MSHKGFREDIVANPLDLSSRLIYADWLDEKDLSVYAEFIRLQIALSDYGIPRISVRKILKSQGPSYWDVEIGGDNDLRVGDRVDVTDPVSGKTRYGLLVSRIVDDPAYQGMFLGVLKKDEKSKRIPQELLHREKSLFPTIVHWFHGDMPTRGAMEYTPRHIRQDSTENNRPQPRFTVVNGFCEIIHCRSEFWWRYGPALVKVQPLRSVTLVDKVPSCLGRFPLYIWWTMEHDPPLDVAEYGPREILPEVWKRMEGFYRYGEYWKGYVTMPGAYAALSKACLCWAREHNSVAVAEHNPLV